MKADLSIAAVSPPIANSRGAGLLVRLFDSLSGDRAYSWADQAIVSITNFLALILIARWCGAADVGIYALGYSVLVMLMAAQESLITRPYSIQLFQPEGTPTQHAFGSLVLSAMLSVAAALALGGGALLLSFFGFSENLATIGWVLAVATPFVLLREFARRFLFAHLKVFNALVLDVAVAALNVAALGGLAAMDSLSAATAFGSLGVSCGIGAVAWLCFFRHEFTATRARLWSVAAKSSVLGKWFFLTQLIAHAQGYSAYWLIMAVVGAAATGIYAACLSIVAFANPMIYGFCNILTPKFVRSLQLEGFEGLKRQAVRDTVLLTALMSLFCVAIFLVGERTMSFLFPGPEYRDHGHALNILALASLAAVVGVPPCTALSSAQRAGIAAGITAVFALVSVAVVWWSLIHWGLLGAAYGMLAAEILGSAGRWLAFLALADRVSEPRGVTKTYRQQATSSPAMQNIPNPKTSSAARDQHDVLLRVFETLDKAGVSYCVLHGYEDYPESVKSDVDIVIDGSWTSIRLYTLLHKHRAYIGAEIISRRGYCLTIASNRSACTLTLDFATSCEAAGLILYDGDAVLAGRRRHGQFWIPEPALEFGCYLGRCVAKGRLDDNRVVRLNRIFRQDAAGCERQIRRFWRGRNHDVILSAAQSGDWNEVRINLHSIRAALRRSAICRAPIRHFNDIWRRLAGRVRRLWQPEGVSVVLLGPDGAGKSSVIETLPSNLSDVFARSQCWGFAPPLHRLIRRRRPSTDQPHGLQPRNAFVSMVRAAYWLGYAICSQVVLRVVLARATLVLYDRHFVDILVDAKRYRYGGPEWVLRLVWRLIPKPDLSILLDAPADTLQRRKQEVPYEETVRQRNAYLALMQRVRNGHTVDASQSRECVADDVARLIVAHLASRVANRHKLFNDSAGAPVNRAIVDVA